MNENAVIYARVSRDEQTKGYSLPTQLDGCRQHATEAGDTVVAEFCEDYTGTTLDRPELDKVRDLARVGSVRKLIVYELDRLARGMAKQIILEQEFARWGVTIEYVLAAYDDSPEGRLQKNVRAVIAEFEREKLLERSIRGKKGRAKAGNVNPGRCARYGYQYIADPDGHKGTYAIVDEEAKIVMLMYTWYVIGDETKRRLGVSKIARRLTKMGVPTRFDTPPKSSKGKRPAKKKGKGFWNETTVRDILSSEIYAGTHYYNRLHKGRSAGEPRIRPKSEWIPISVPAIVSRELWNAAQERRQENTKVAARNTKHPYLMRGRLRCTKCGRIMTCRTDLRFDTPRSVYVCNSGHMYDYEDDMTTLKCRGTIKADVLDAAVWEAIKRRLKEPASIYEVIQKEADDRLAAVAMLANQRDIAENQRAIRIADRKVLVEKYLKGKVPEDLYDEKMAEYAMTIPQFEAEIAQLDDKIRRAIPDPAARANIDRFCADVADEIDNYTFDDMRNVVESLNITALVTREDGRAKLALSGMFPATTVEVIDGETPSCSALNCSVPFSLFVSVEYDPAQARSHAGFSAVQSQSSIGA